MDRGVVTPEIEKILSRYRFDEELFDLLVDKLVRGEMGAENNRLRATVTAPKDGGWERLSSVGSKEREKLEALGLEAIKGGEVGLIVLNGGMATRFGGTVKCAVPVIEGRSFLELKVLETKGISDGKSPIYLMNSFATDERTRELAQQLGLQDLVEHFTQSVLLRVTPEGEPFFDDRGQLSPASPGHGDLVDSLRACGVLSSFIANGGRYLVMANVDNLGASLSPAVVGAHIKAQKPMTVEVTEKAPGDKGGAPALVDGHLQIVEDFRFPRDFDQDSIPVFNTNTFVFNADAIDRSFELTWFAVRKTVADQSVVQFERLAGELTAHLDAQYLLVEREGPDGRFFPVKDPNELERRLPAIERVLRRRGVL